MHLALASLTFAAALFTALNVFSTTEMPLVSKPLSEPQSSRQLGAYTPSATIPNIPCGLLDIQIEPSGASTVLDGLWLDTNVWLISLMPGEHSVEFRKEGFQTVTKQLSVISGEKLSLRIQLEKEGSVTKP